MKKNIITENPYFIFSPFLIILLALVLIFKTDGTFGDEPLYLTLAKNILNGYYSDPSQAIEIGNGPGYPILLVPFLALRLPLVYITIMNAVLYYFSIILLYKVLLQFVSKQFALIFSLFWACYANSYEYLCTIHSETLAHFLILIISFNLVRAFNSDYILENKRQLFLSGFFIGYLILTKPIFGYVLLFLFIGYGLQWIIIRKTSNQRKAFVILLISLATMSPYLIYTYNLTGKIFYLSTNGGNNLYWMSSPYKEEYGSWFPGNFDVDSIYFPNLILGGKESSKSNHRKDFEEISKYKGIEQDDAYKKIAIKNIKSNPFKFAQNCVSNIGRILFNFPFSYKAQTPRLLLRLPFNGIILVLAFYCIIPTYRNWRKIPYSIRFLLIFAALYFCGSILGSAETRMFTIIVPILLVWIAFIIQKTVKVTLKFDTKS